MLACMYTTYTCERTWSSTTRTVSSDGPINWIGNAGLITPLLGSWNWRNTRNCIWIVDWPEPSMPCLKNTRNSSRTSARITSKTPSLEACSSCSSRRRVATSRLPRQSESVFKLRDSSAKLSSWKAASESVTQMLMATLRNQAENPWGLLSIVLSVC